jgi:hypothetical protein
MSFTGIPRSPGDGQRDPALGRPVELGEDDPVHGDGLGEQLGLAQPVLPRGRVDGEQRLVRRVGHLLADHAPDLRQLLHEVVLVVQAPGRVDDDHVGPALAALGDRRRRPRPRVAPVAARDDVAARAGRPALELLAGRRAEGVGGAEDHGLPELALQVPGELADRRRLARAR